MNSSKKDNNDKNLDPRDEWLEKQKQKDFVGNEGVQSDDWLKPLRRQGWRLNLCNFFDSLCKEKDCEEVKNLLRKKLNLMCSNFYSKVKIKRPEDYDLIVFGIFASAITFILIDYFIYVPFWNLLSVACGSCG